MKKCKGVFIFLFVMLAASQMAFVSLSSRPMELKLDNIKTISRSSYYIQHEYYDSSRIKPRKMLEEGFFELAKQVPEVMPKFAGNVLDFRVGSKKINIDVSGLKQFYDILYPVSQAFEFLKKNYQGEEKFDDMEYAFVNGMLSVLDPHSLILPPKAYEEFKTQTSGEYGGLGIVIGMKDDELTVIAPIEDTPAWRAGIKAEDKILQIGDQATANMTLSEAVDLMRGVPKTKIALKVRSKSQEPREVELTREVITIVSVQSKLLEKDQKKIGVIRVKGFQEDTYTDLVKAYNQLSRKANGQLAGVVLDLRNNPGGLLDQAILIADKFLSHGNIVYTAGASESDEEVARSRNQKTDIKLPTVVLINEGSASASEIVAGALKNNNRAIVMGKKSFGKGSVQSLFNMRDGSSLKLTVAQYLTPGKVSIQAQGIVPDIHLYPSIVNDELIDVREDQLFSEEKLEAHLENSKYLKPSLPFYDMTFLLKEEKETENQYTSKIREENDYPLQLAARILSHTDKTEKEAMLKDVKDVLAKETKEQDKLIISALKEKELDWGLGQTIDKPKFSVSYQFYDESNKKINVLPAGQKVSVKVSVKNLSAQPLHRVMAEVESFNPLINGKELLYGKLAPQASLTREFDVKVPSEIINFKEAATLNLYTEKTIENPYKTSIATQFIEKTSPHLAYSYKIWDGGKKGTKGNQNGIPEKGEQIAMEVMVKNFGPGVSEKTVVNLQNTLGDHVFLEKARDTIGKIAAKQEKKAELKFAVKDSFHDDEFTIKFFAVDNETKSTISDTLVFNKKMAKIEPKPEKLQVIPRIEMEASTRQIHNRYKVVAQIKNDTNLKDIAVFVKGKKLYYDNLENEKKKTKLIDVTLPLEDGLNSIVIQARGARELINQKNLSVVYKEEGKLAAAKKGEEDLLKVH